MDHTLIERQRKLIAIEQAGLLPELRRRMGLARRHRPRSPFHENPWLVVDADHLARITSEITGDSLAYCRRHAVEAITRTQRQDGYDEIDAIYAEIQGNGGRL
jgi:hypothetical protein